MGWASEIFGLVKDVVTLTERQESLGRTVEKLTDGLSEVDKRVVRLEARLDTIMDIAATQRRLE